MKWVGTLGLLSFIAVSSSGYADVKGFVQICENPRMADATRKTIDSLHKMVSGFRSVKFTCQELETSFPKSKR